MKTKNKKWAKIFYDIKQRCTNPNDTGYKYYGGKGIKCKITKEEIKQLWFRDNADNLKEPSIDREDSKKDYVYDNCRFIELSLNRQRANKDQSKTIIQYDLEGNYIKTWDSITEASKSLNIWRQNISKCINGFYKSSGGYKWILKGV